MGAIVNPQNTTSEIADIVDATQETVLDRFTQVTEAASGALQDAMAFLNQLQNAAGGGGFFVPNIGSFFPPPISPSFNIGEPPVAPGIELYLPAFPDSPILQTITLLTSIQTRLVTDLANGATGLAAGVENDIWNREAERTLLAHQEELEVIAAQWSTRGYELPDGTLVALINQSEIDYRNKRVDRSRDIAIKQAEMAFQNTQFLIQQILAMESLVINAVSEGNKSLIEEYKANMDGYRAQVQAAIDKLGAYLKAYDTSGNVYKAKAEAQAAIAGVDIKAAEASINATIAQMQLFLKEAELQITQIDAQARIRVAAAEAGGRITAQLAAGLFSGISVQAHLSAGAQIGKSYTGHEGVTENYNFTKVSPT
jgi:hypothetical protein